MEYDILVIAILLSFGWNAVLTFYINLLKQDISHNRRELKKKAYDSYLRNIEERVGQANGDVNILARKLGYYFDTIPAKDSKRVLKDVENDEIQDEKINLKTEIDQ